MSEKKTSTPTEDFVRNMTHQMFSDFWYAMNARLHTDASLSLYINQTGTLSAEEIDMVNNNQYIKAIKNVRYRLGLRLKESKDMVDAYMKANNLH